MARLEWDKNTIRVRQSADGDLTVSVKSRANAGLPNIAPGITLDLSLRADGLSGTHDRMPSYRVTTGGTEVYQRDESWAGALMPFWRNYRFEGL